MNADIQPQPLTKGTNHAIRLICFTAYFVLSVVHVSAQKLNEDSIKKVIREAKADTTRIDAMLTYANYLVRRELNDSLGLALVADAIKLSEKNKYPIGLAQALLIKGNYYRRVNNLAKSIETFEDIIKVSEQIKDSMRRKEALLKVYNNLGGIYNIHGDFTGSLERRLKSVQIIESMPFNANNLAIASINTASDYRQLKQFNKAKEYMNKVTPYVDSLKDFLKVEYWFEYYYVLMGSNDTLEAFHLLNHIDSSIENLKLTRFDKLDYGSLSSKLHGDYEMNYTGNYVRALPWFRQHLDFARQMNNTSEICSSLFNLGWCYYELKDYPKSINFLRQSYDSAEKSGRNNIAFKAANLLAKAYAATNTPDKGLFYSQRTLALKDSISSQEKISQLNFLEAKYQYEKKEKEISNLQAVNQEKEFVIRKKNWMITGSLVLLGLLLFLSFLLYRYFKNRQALNVKEKALQVEKISSLEKKQQVISLQSMINGQETERTRIARDLHDGLGGIFSTVKMHFSTLQHDVPDLRGNQLYKKSFDLVDSASEELRKIAHNMMPEVLLKMGLVPALQDLCNNINAGRLLHISLQDYGMEKRLAASTEIMLYRIIQELINNIIKHAYASEAIIQINREGSRLSITVEDNGRGFDIADVEKKRSMGIQTIKSRVDYLNGKLTMESSKDVGTTIMIDLRVDD